VTAFLFARNLHAFSATSNKCWSLVFQQFWKPFFDELITESNNLYNLYSETMTNPQPFARELQRIAKQGLKHFKQVTDSYKNSSAQ
jgi:hypothetical protein